MYIISWNLPSPKRKGGYRDVNAFIERTREVKVEGKRKEGCPLSESGWLRGER